MGQLPKEVTESEWYKNLPEANWMGMIEQYRDRLAVCGIDLDQIEKTYLAFVATLVTQWERYGKILSFEKIFEHLEEAHQEYEKPFENGFCDMSMNVEIAVEKIKEKYYQEETE